MDSSGNSNKYIVKFIRLFNESSSTIDVDLINDLLQDTVDEFLLEKRPGHGALDQTHGRMYYYTNQNSPSSLKLTIYIKYNRLNPNNEIDSSSWIDRYKRILRFMETSFLNRLHSLGYSIYLNVKNHNIAVIITNGKLTKYDLDEHEKISFYTQYLPKGNWASKMYRNQ